MGYFALEKLFRSSFSFASPFNTTLDTVQYSRDYGAQIFVPQTFPCGCDQPFLGLRPAQDPDKSLLSFKFLSDSCYLRQRTS
jgi:hypothetical protein